jgi:hypothetical protein
MPDQNKTIELIKAKDCKHSVVFAPSADNTDPIVSGIYISRNWVEINNAKKVKVTFEIVN